MKIFMSAQFSGFGSHVPGTHRFKDTGDDRADRFRMVGPNVTEDSNPKEYGSPLINHSDLYKKSVYHGGYWTKPMPERMVPPEKTEFGHTVTHM